MTRYKYDHVHLISPDPLKAAEFYERAFNATRVSVGKYPDGGTRVELNLGGTTLLIRSGREKDLSTDTPKKRYGLEHFGFETDDIESAVADLKKKGIKSVEDIRVSLPTGARITFVTAPDNVMIELFQRP